MDTPDINEMDEISRDNVLVLKMITQNLPFTREQYIELFYEGEGMPSPWTDVHEKQLPPVFQDPQSDQVREAISNLGEAIGVTYLGEIPR
ncbi:MAG: hypothetical protein CMQ05_13765 [Gammaproteobacteria bacterium]|nr:hypothetical protein [Gammaproteobacteria bacterium]RPG23876.1 MAG: hypothetical protein CBC10_013385 [Gammaproteobacteria bacterium TMED50]|tara:strand:- start:233 stop:502 length:270 start_codon:yes stop_codon:yes gene_type:complete